MTLNSTWSLIGYAVNPTTNTIATAEWRIDYTATDFNGVTASHYGVTPVPGDLPPSATQSEILTAVQSFMYNQMPQIEYHIRAQLEWDYQQKQATEKIDLRTPQEKREQMVQLSRAQILLTLFDEEGITEVMINAAISMISDPDEAERARINWTSRSSYKRTHPLIAQIGLGFSLSDERIDELWASGQTK